MDAKLKAEWIAALRSGDYEQTQGVLCNGKAYCCLGILCTVMGAEFGDYRASPLDDDDTLECQTDRHMTTLRNRPILDGKVLADSNGWDDTLSAEVLNEVGISAREQDELVTLNDCDMRSFSSIADYIEETL